ncbi:MAG: haloacid dehalogenase-like hydrolase, partial [Hydrogenoanaerobacterium sp.]
KRILDCKASDFIRFNRADFLKSITESEGRVLACETIGTVMPMLGDITNAELAASMGADILLLNIFDVQKPCINALPKVPPQETIRELKRLTGRIIGINLEPVEKALSNDTGGDMWALTDGRRATVQNAKAAMEMGVNLILLTGNPGIGVNNSAIIQSLSAIRAAAGDGMVLAAGKMHASGICSEGGESILTKADIKAFVKAGADIILLPAPATVPGITVEYARELVSYAHSLGALTITAIGTSQEGADTATMRQLALMCKMTGTDIHHLGDAGYGGIALPENIVAYSVAMRGVRHTYHRMASSVNR